MTKAIILSGDSSIFKSMSATLRQFYAEDLEEEIVSPDNLEEFKRMKQKVGKPCLVFIDLDSGIDVSIPVFKSLNVQGTPMICMSTKESDALKAIRLHAADFLLKPIDQNELRKALRNLKFRKDPLDILNSKIFAQQLPNKIAISGIKQTIFISPNDIIRIEFKNPHSILYLTNGKTHYNTKPLKEFEDLLMRYNFVRVNPSTLINIAHVTAHINGEGGFAVMSDGEKVCISRRKKSNFMEMIQI